MEPSTPSRRQLAIDYVLLNDGYEGEEPMENVSLASGLQSPIESSFELGPEDSISQIVDRPLSRNLTEEAQGISPVITDDVIFSQPTRGTANHWLWEQFEVTTLSQQWKPKRSKKLRNDQLITCKHCRNWSIKDSARSTSTTNMSYHLHRAHGLGVSNDTKNTNQPTIMTMWNQKQTVNVTELLERNLIRWVVLTRQPFTVIEPTAFLQIFKDIPGVEMPFTTRKTLRQRIDIEFEACRARLKEELDKTCHTIALSLDVWTSQNHIAILGVVAHWLTGEFEYRERVLEFGEVIGVHTGENMAEMVYSMLKELGLTKKLITITADNASNNRTFVESLSLKLTEEADDVRFQGHESFISCLAHVLNLIVKDILKALKCGNINNQIRDGKPIGPHSALSRLRILSLWILRSPQRREGWKNLCSVNGLNDKYIEYDVDTRWNSTYRMLQGGIAAKEQIRCYLNAVRLLPPFTASDWEQLEQIATVLEKFDEFTNLVSSKGSRLA